MTAQTTLAESLRDALVPDTEEAKIATLFARGQGKTIHEKFNALFDAIIADGTATTINAANTANLNALTSAFPTDNSINQRLDAVLNALVKDASTPDTSAVSKITTPFANGAGQDINAKLSAILNALVRNAGEPVATTSDPAGQIKAQFANGVGQDLDSKMDAVLNALVMNAGTQDNPTMSITQVFDNTASKTVSSVMANADLALNSLVSESQLHVICIEFSY